ncbi:PepSY domain-containing protein [Sphingomonas adhaesiva]|uniref:PepSY domain-containing protein n=1 Tax=Sphingomonas adhaesiva TaxID=28212 RepID=UPI002FF8D0B2
MRASDLRRLKERATRNVAWLHRWLGVATCVIFALWFASGAVLLFMPFPSLPRADQLALERAVDVAAVRVSPGTAIAAAGTRATGVRLVQRGERPAYIVTGMDDISRAIDARTGAALPLLSAGAARRIAVDAVGPGATVGPPADYDQWIVHNRFDAFRPFYRIDANDSAGTRYYLSARSGELMQRTDAAGRGWNWIGAVLHWAYFTPLRADFTAWDRTVWWVSLVALIVAVTGTVLGIVRTIAAQRQRRPSLTFYRLRWMRWHHLLGLFAGIFVLGWILSGWLSMDHGRLFSRGQPLEAQARGYQGMTAGRGFAIDPQALRALGGAHEIGFTQVAGRALATGWWPAGTARRVLGDGAVVPDAALLDFARQGVAAGWPGGPGSVSRRVPPTSLYALAEGWPATAILMTDPGGIRPDIAIDGADGRILTVMDPSRKAYAWIYYALHTFNVPGLSDHQRWRKATVLVPLVFGFIFSVTGVVLGMERIRKQLRQGKVR